MIYCFMDSLNKKNIVLLAASLIFYAWGGPKYLVILLLMCVISWLSAILIDDNRDDPLRKKIFLIAGIGLQLGLLAYYKYAGLS